MRTRTESQRGWVRWSTALMSVAAVCVGTLPPLRPPPPGIEVIDGPIEALRVKDDFWSLANSAENKARVVSYFKELDLPVDPNAPKPTEVPYNARAERDTLQRFFEFPRVGKHLISAIELLWQQSRRILFLEDAPMTIWEGRLDLKEDWGKNHLTGMVRVTSGEVSAYMPEDAPREGEMASVPGSGPVGVLWMFEDGMAPELQQRDALIFAANWLAFHRLRALVHELGRYTGDYPLFEGGIVDESVLLRRPQRLASVPGKKETKVIKEPGQWDLPQGVGRVDAWRAQFGIHAQTFVGDNGQIRAQRGVLLLKLEWILAEYIAALGDMALDDNPSV